VGRFAGEGRLRAIAAVLAVLGIGVATYVAITEFGGGIPICVAGGHGCETVAHSKYSHLGGINIAVFGIAGYVLILGASVLRGDPGRLGAFIFSTIGFGFSAYLTYLELFTINAICQWCVASAVLMALLFAVNALRAYRFLGRTV
jgi:uncharacterized membrane protein